MEQAEILKAVRQILTDYLQEHKMRCTQERYAILETIYNTNRHFTAEELFQQMEGHFRVSRVTVYNSMDLFVQLGLIVRHTFTTVVSYEKCFGVRDHFHLICTHCGNVKEIRVPNITRAIDGTKFPRFHANSITLCAFGICSSCQSKLTRKRKQKEKLVKTNTKPIK